MVENDCELRKLQELEFENLNLFVRICKENNLRYCLIGGTLIGVVRHQGFIPWDDDIDVGMPRLDYNKFLQIARNYLPDYMDIKSKTSEPNYKCYFSRLINNKKKIYWDQGQYTAQIGVWMDIFPIDGLPHNRIARSVHVLHVYWLKMLYKFTQIDYVTTNKKRSMVEWIAIGFAKITRIGKMLSADKMLNKIDKTLQKYDYNCCDYAWNYSGGHGFHEVMPKKLWEGGRIGLFEGLEVSIPKCTEEHLTYIFGDYMKLPPEEQRISHPIKFVE